MSLASETDDNDKDFPILKQDFSNWAVWIEKVEDYLRGAKHYKADSMISASWWVPEADDEGDPAIAFRQLPTSSKAEQDFKVVHQAAFAFIRRKLSSSLFQKTIAMRHKTVPDLLRLLRTTWNDGSAIDRARLRVEMEACKPDLFATFVEFLTVLDNNFANLEAAGVNTYRDDEDKLHKLLSSLDNTWRIHKSTVIANEMDYDRARAFLQKVAKSDPDITGTSLVASKQSKNRRSDQIHSAQEQRVKPACWKFAKGKCTRGDDCKFTHGNTNNAGCGQNSGQGKPNGAGAGQASQRKCSACKGQIKGPKHWKKCGDCFKHGRKEQDASAHAANAVSQASNPVERGSLTLLNPNSTFGGAAFATTQFESGHYISLNPTNTAHAMRQVHVGSSARAGGSILVAMDSGATCGVMESSEHCIEVTSANTTVKVGGEGKPTFVQVRHQGILPIEQIVDGRRVSFRLPVFIVPGFGISIFPLSFLLKRKIKVEFNETLMTATGPDGHVKMQARALHHDRESWLFYAHLRVDGAHVPLHGESASLALTATKGPPKQGTGEAGAGACAQDAARSRPSSVAPDAPISSVGTTDLVYATHAIYVEDGEHERQRLAFLPEYELDKAEAVVRDEAGQVLAVTARDPKALAALFHKRFGHRNYRDTADELGIQLPPEMPQCITCKLAKSKRAVLTGGAEALFDPPRNGHTWAWDHGGPFKVPDWDGNTMFSLKICLKSGKLVPRMVNTTGTATAEWQEFVRRLNAHFGRPTVARLITDGAPYFSSIDMEIFNNAQGIVHTQLPAHTQELNGVVERTFGTIYSMARAAMLEACTPERAYGLCLVMMTDTLNTLRHRRGGRLSRNEKWLNKLLPDQHKRLGVWAGGLRGGAALQPSQPRPRRRARPATEARPTWGDVRPGGLRRVQQAGAAN